MRFEEILSVKKLASYLHFAKSHQLPSFKIKVLSFGNLATNTSAITFDSIEMEEYSMLK